MSSTICTSESLPSACRMAANSAISAAAGDQQRHALAPARRSSRRAGCGRRRPAPSVARPWLRWPDRSVQVGARVGGEHDRVVRLAPGDGGHGLPQFLGDERDQRVRQAQHGFQCAHQRAAGAALLGFVAGLDLDLGDFQVPVAELVPDEFVDGLGEQVETVVGKVLFDFLLRCAAAG
jgi:hypothetical protein